jgi:hypothetical protein
MKKKNSLKGSQYPVHSRALKTLEPALIMSRCITKSMNLEKPKQLIIWNGGSTF